MPLGSMQPQPSAPGFAVRPILAVLVMALGPMVFGMSLGFTSPAADTMRGVVKVDGVVIPTPAHLKAFNSDAEASMFGSAINIGAVIGALLGGPLADSLGRRGGILVTMPVCAMSWLLTAIGHDFSELIIGRILAGIGVGSVSVLVPIYIAETAPTRLRGTLGATNQLAITIGIFIVYMLGGTAFRAGETGHDNVFCQWRLLAFAIIVPTVLLFVLAFFIPETPRFHISRGNLTAAQRSIERLRRVESGAQMLNLAASQSQSQSSAPGMFSQEMRGRLWDCRRALRIGILAMVFQQLSGCNAVMFYLNHFLMEAKISWYAMAGTLTMLLQVFMTGLACYLMDKAGRRSLLLLSFSGMGLSAFFLGLFFAIQPATGVTAPWMLIAAVFSYIASFSIGVGPIPWLLMAEIFPADVRGTACTIATVVNWTGSFLITLTVQPMSDALGYAGTFWLYSCLCICGVIYTALLVVETKGKSLEEITSMLAPKGGDIRSLLNAPLTPPLSPLPQGSPIEGKV